MKYRFDPAGRRLPIKLDSTSNGEFEPIPLSPPPTGWPIVLHTRGRARTPSGVVLAAGPFWCRCAVLPVPCWQ